MYRWYQRLTVCLLFAAAALGVAGCPDTGSNTGYQINFRADLNPGPSTSGGGGSFSIHWRFKDTE